MFWKLFRKKEEIVELRFQDVEKWLNEEMAEFLSVLNKKAHKFWSDIKFVREKLLDELQKLERASLQEEIDQRLCKIATDNRAALVRKLSPFFNSIQLKESYEQASSFAKSSAKNFLELSAKCRRNLAITGRFFKAETKSVLHWLNKFDVILKEFANLKEEKKFRRIKEVHRIAQDGGKLLATLHSSKAELKKMRKKLIEEEKSAKKVREKILEVLKSTEMFEVSRKESKLKEEVQRCQIEIMNLISPLSKIMRKFFHAGGIEKGEARIMRLYLTSPLDALREDDKLVILDLVSRIRVDKLKLSEKKRARVSESIHQILKGRLIKLNSRLSSLEKELQELKERKSLVKKVEMELEEINARLVKLKKDKSIRMSKIASLEEELKKCAKSLERELREVTGKKVKILH
jgi:predicted  nucleic acid-binding Zn-ribbon protein